MLMRECPVSVTHKRKQLKIVLPAYNWKYICLEDGTLSVAGTKMKIGVAY